MRIRRLPQAIRDIDGIWDWVAAEDMAAADRLIARITRAANRLADFPESGPARPEIGEGVRSLVVGRYLVLYRIGPDCVDIVRIVHGAQQMESILRSD